MTTRSWIIYGATGHTQRESYAPSKDWDFSADGKTRRIQVLNADKTGTNYYSIIRITRDTAEECEAEFLGQLDDGIFEGSRVGSYEEIIEGEEIAIYRVKPEYYDLWGAYEGHDTVTFQQIADLAAEWEKPISELMEQVEAV